jgi:hypothetical protein
MTNLLEQAIACDDGDRATKIISRAAHSFIGDWLQPEAPYLACEH